jgi:hypothetical protein
MACPLAGEGEGNSFSADTDDSFPVNSVNRYEFQETGAYAADRIPNQNALF